MTILRSGTSKQYSENWGSAFGGKKTAKKSKSTTAKKKSNTPKKKATKKN